MAASYSTVACFLSKLTVAFETTGDGETYKVSEMKTKGKV